MPAPTGTKYVRVYERNGEPGEKCVQLDLLNGLTISFLIGYGYSGKRTSEVAFWATTGGSRWYSKPSDFPVPAPTNDSVYGWVPWETIVEYVERVGVRESAANVDMRELLALPPASDQPEPS